MDSAGAGDPPAASDTRAARKSVYVEAAPKVARSATAGAQPVPPPAAAAQARGSMPCGVRSATITADSSRADR